MYMAKSLGSWDLSLPYLWGGGGGGEGGKNILRISFSKNEKKKIQNPQSPTLNKL